jgi:hypothetical protein
MPPTLTANVRPWTTRVQNFIPSWMANRPSFQQAFKFVWVHAFMCDVAVQSALEGMRAAWPGYDGRTDNLGLIGQARQLIQGETETAASFGARCRAWLTNAKTMGGDIGLATNLRAWIAGNPAVTVIDRCASIAQGGLGARYTMISSSGVVTQQYAAFDWDSQSNPERATYWWDSWIVIFTSTVPSGYYVFNQGTWGAADSGAAWNATSGWGLGSTMLENDTIRGLVSVWKGLHANCRAIVWCPDNTLFQPSTPIASGNPNGWWGKWFRSDTNQPSRNRNLRYSSLGTEVTS